MPCYRQQLIGLERGSRLRASAGRTLRRWKDALIIVQPDTVLRWHRDPFRHCWRRQSKCRAQPGRPPLTEDVVTLIKGMCTERQCGLPGRMRPRAPCASAEN